jgi:hypothetical protein
MQLARYSKAVAPFVAGILAALVAFGVVDEEQGSQIGTAVTVLATTILTTVSAFLAPANQ